MRNPFFIRYYISNLYDLFFCCLTITKAKSWTMFIIEPFIQNFEILRDTGTLHGFYWSTQVMKS